MLHADTAAPTCTGQGDAAVEVDTAGGSCMRLGDAAVEGDTAGGSCMGQGDAAGEGDSPCTYPGQGDSLGDAGDCDWELEGVLAR